MNFSIITETFPPDINGVSLTLQKLSEGLASRGHELTILRSRTAAPNDPPASGFREIPVASFPLQRYPQVRLGGPAFPTLFSAWLPQRPDAVYVATEGLLGLAAIAVARWLKIPVVTGYHTHFVDYLPAYGLDWLAGIGGRYQRWLHNLARCTLVPSGQALNRLRHAGFRRACLMRRGVDAELFSPLKRDEALRSSWGAAPGDTVVLSVGRIAAEKNLPLALRTVKRLRDLGERVHFVAVGDGPLLDSCREEFPWAHFPGELRGEVLPSHYASADIFAFPSQTETFGNVLLEAMASGLPSVCFDAAAAREHIVDGENGWAVPLGNESAFRGQLTDAIHAAPSVLDAVGAAARLTALDLEWDAIISRFECVLTSAGTAGNEPSISQNPPLHLATPTLSANK